jgi:hypothetical protein
LGWIRTAPAATTLYQQSCQNHPSQADFHQ